MLSIQMTLADGKQGPISDNLQACDEMKNLVNIDILVPNSEFFGTRLTNWTHRDSLARIRIPFGVAYGSNKQNVVSASLKAAAEVEYTLKKMPGKEPEVRMTGFGNSSLNFELLVWVSRTGVRHPGRVRSAYLWALESQLQEAGIEIPFPQRDLHLRTGFPGNTMSDTTHEDQ